MLNSGHIRRKVDTSPKLRALPQSSKTEHEAADALYLTILSRFPTAEELKAIEAYTQGAAAGNRGQPMRDVAWTLINSVEFCYRH